VARIEFGAGITDIVGSIAGWTFQRNRSGSIVRTRPRQPKFNTPKQTSQQSAFVGLIQDFQQLSPGDKLAWDAFATSNTKINRFGQTKILTGQNWFTAINSARARLALAQLSTPPANLLPEAITGFNLTVDATKIEISTITPDNPTDTGLFIQTTFPNTLTTKDQRSALRETATLSSGPFGTIDLTPDWEAAHTLPWPPGSVANCINVMVQLVPVRVSTGITGVAINKVSGLDFVGSGIGSMEIESTFIVS
jgi:hypothetical protein